MVRNNIFKSILVLSLLIIPIGCINTTKSFNYTLYEGNVFIKEITTSKTKTFKTVLLKDKTKFYEVRVPNWFTDIYLPSDTIK